MKKNDKYNYVDGKQLMEHGSRIYDVAGYRLPSVTTVLGKTKNQQFLKDWANAMKADAKTYDVLEERLEKVLKTIRKYK